MSDIQKQQQEAVNTVFEMYDVNRVGFLMPKQLQKIHAEMRIGGISLQQVIASMKYTCSDTESCDQSELFDLLQEMDRRYYLLEGFRWEFTSLDYTQTDTISEEHALWFVQNVHGDYFSKLRWDNFLRSRLAPKTGVTFAEIEVMLCDIPSKLENEQELEMLEKLKQEKIQRQENDLKRMAEELERKQKEKQERELRRLKEEEQRMRDEEKRHNQEEADRKQKEKDRMALEKREKALAEEEEKARLEELQRKHLGDIKDKQDNIAAVQKLLALQQKTKEEEEKWNREAMDAPGIQKHIQELKQVEADEKKALEEAQKAEQEAKKAEEARDRKEAEEIEKEARIRAREAKNKKTRLNLKLRVKTRDTERLPPAIKNFKRAKLPDTDGDLAKGERIMKEELAREKLVKAMENRNLKELEKAVTFAKKGGFEIVLSHELIEANKLIIQLRRLERIRAEILELKQSTVAEIRSYQKPPEIVHHVMTGTFLLLNHKEKETSVWKTVQALVGKTGKEGLKRRCLECTPQKLNKDFAKRAKQIYGKYGLDEVRDVSAGAATFYLWGTTIIEELEAIEVSKAMEAEKKAKKKAKKEKLKKMIAEKEKEERMREEGNNNGENEGEEVKEQSQE